MPGTGRTAPSSPGPCSQLPPPRTSLTSPISALARSAEWERRWPASSSSPRAGSGRATMASPPAVRCRAGRRIASIVGKWTTLYYRQRGRARLPQPARARHKPRSSGLTHVLDKGASRGSHRVGPAAAARRTSTSGSSAGAPPTSTPRCRPSWRCSRRPTSGPASAGRCWRSPGPRARTSSAWTGRTRSGSTASRSPAAWRRMPLEDKHDLLARGRGALRRALRGREQGPADPRRPGSGRVRWPGDLAAGATWVITEGRESGTVGLYRSDGSVREELLAAVLAGRGPRPAPLRGAPQGPAGLADPRASVRTSTSPTSPWTTRWRWRRCASGCAPTPSSCRAGMVPA